MPKIALDPTPYHHDLSLLEFPQKVADLGYEYLQLTPHKDFIPLLPTPQGRRRPGRRVRRGLP